MIELLRLRPGLATAFGAAMFLALGAGPAAAGTDSTTMSVTATVVNNCAVSATDLIFGDYTGVADVDSNFIIDVTCTDDTAVTLSDDGGFFPDVGALRRRMGFGADFLTYVLDDDPGFTSEFFTNNDLVVPTTTLFPYTFYGRIPGGQAAPSGLYGDTLTWTLTW